MKNKLNKITKFNSRTTLLLKGKIEKKIAMKKNILSQSSKTIESMT